MCWVVFIKFLNQLFFPENWIKHFHSQQWWGGKKRRSIYNFCLFLNVLDMNHQMTRFKQNQSCWQWLSTPHQRITRIILIPQDHFNLSLQPSRCIKASFYIPENRPNFPTTKEFFNENFHETVFSNMWQFSLIFRPPWVIFIHYKSRIATAIRGL